MSDLTPRQQEILGFLQEWMKAQGSAPTRAELARAFAINVNAAEKHLHALARKGVLEMIPGTARGIRLAQGPGLPLIGRVAAGQPLLAVENILGHHPVEPTLFKPRADYLLQVQGTSMRDAGILDGDWVAVHRTPEAESGQIVVARLDDEVTLKRLKRVRRRIELHAENPEFAAILVDAKRHSFAIEGIYVGLVRRP
jgi:repressor LexA